MKVPSVSSRKLQYNGIKQLLQVHSPLVLISQFLRYDRYGYITNTPHCNDATTLPQSRHTRTEGAASSIRLLQ